MIYCEGTNCSRRDQCAYHESFEWEHPRQVRDCSAEGTSYGPFYDEHNKAYMKTHWDCGDNADNHYSHYKALGWREGQNYRNSAGTICDEVCLTCPHQALCFSILEFAGMVFRPGDRVRFDCEDIKKDPNGRQEWLNKQLDVYYKRVEYYNKKEKEL